MSIRTIITLSVLLVSTTDIGAQTIAVDGCTFRFASVEQARVILSADDDFTRRLSKFDVQSRLKTIDKSKPSDYQQAIADTCIPWTQERRASVSAAAVALVERLRPYSLPLPDEILFVCTTGAVEADAPHTRASAIVLPTKRISGSRSLTRLLAHELFHILSRQNPEWRDKMYESIGYRRCNELKLPDDLNDQRLTNPDAPIVQHFIEISVNGRKVPIAQVILSRIKAFDPADPRPFFAFLDVRFVELTKQGDQMVPALDTNGAMISHATKDLTDFLSQIGHNTKYIIHPEEILADNFSFLVTGKKVASPDVLDRMKALMRKNSKLGN